MGIDFNIDNMDIEEPINGISKEVTKDGIKFRIFKKINTNIKFGTSTDSIEAAARYLGKQPEKGTTESDYKNNRMIPKEREKFKRDLKKYGKIFIESSYDSDVFHPFPTH